MTTKVPSPSSFRTSYCARRSPINVSIEEDTDEEMAQDLTAEVNFLFVQVKVVIGKCIEGRRHSDDEIR